MADHYGSAEIITGRFLARAEAGTKPAAFTKWCPAPGAMTRAVVQEGIEDGTIQPCNPKIAAFTIAGALNWICHWYEPDGALSPEEIATQFVRTLTLGLAADKKSAGPRLVKK